MTQEEKQLLIKDLCARLPYDDYKVQIKEEEDYIPRIAKLIPSYIDDIKYCTIASIKVYLRPMQSMTEEEFLEYFHIKYGIVTRKNKWMRIDVGKYHNVGIVPIGDYLDWRNAHHFDHHDLIGKGLALEAPKDMYN